MTRATQTEARPYRLEIRDLMVGETVFWKTLAYTAEDARHQAYVACSARKSGPKPRYRLMGVCAWSEGDEAAEEV